MNGAVQLSDEFKENFIENTFELWFDDALEQKGIDRDDFRKGQVFIRNPFALSQFEDLNSSDSDVDVLVNDDAQVNLLAELDTNRTIEKGDDIYAEEIVGFEEVLLEDEQEDYGHVTLVKANGFGWYFNFDFRRNRSYYEPLLDAADQFITLAEHAKESELWRGFVENAFHAAERMMKIDVIFMGWTAEQHSDVQARYSDLVQLGQGNADLYDVFNQLIGKYRFSASYVDPRGDVAEREFEFDDEKADAFITVIKEHRENLSDEL